MIRIVEYIEANEKRKGLGTPDDPVRFIYQLWTKDGVLIAEHDPCGETWFKPPEVLQQEAWAKALGR